MQTIIISRTAHQTGFGQRAHKRVVYLTPEEREAARKGATVVYDSGRLSGGNHGTVWRVAVPQENGTFFPRVPSAELINILECKA